MRRVDDELDSEYKKGADTGVLGTSKRSDYGQLKYRVIHVG
jgi:hypothetical protein